MSYSRACELLGFTTPKSLRANAELAKSALRHFAPNIPLRYLVACDVLIKALEYAKHALKQCGGRVLIVCPLMVCRQTEGCWSDISETDTLNTAAAKSDEELKPEYYAQACRNLEKANSSLADSNQGTLFDLMEV